MSDQGAEGLLSPLLRKRRFSAVQPYLIGRVLDVGCGSGSLAGIVSADRYLGIDQDTESLDIARSRFPNHAFAAQFPASEEYFDTVVALAVIEHVPDHAAFLRMLARYLRGSVTARLIVTTPHPSVGWIHSAGAAIGLFSRQAGKEHKTLLYRTTLMIAGEEAGLHLMTYRRFLFGANQIATFVRRRV